MSAVYFFFFAYLKQMHVQQVNRDSLVEDNFIFLELLKILQSFDYFFCINDLNIVLTCVLYLLGKEPCF